MDISRRAAAMALASGLIRMVQAQESETVSKRRPASDIPADGDQPVIRVDVDLVNLFCSVRRHNGKLVSNLTQDDFRVFEDGREQTVTAFSRETDLPVKLGMMVDISGSQRNLIGAERDAASAFFSNVMRKQDEAFLLSFGRDTDLLQDYTNSVPKLQAALNGLGGDMPAGGGRPGGGRPGGQQGGGRGVEGVAAATAAVDKGAPRKEEEMVKAPSCLTPFIWLRMTNWRQSQGVRP